MLLCYISEFNSDNFALDYPADVHAYKNLYKFTTFLTYMLQNGCSITLQKQ